MITQNLTSKASFIYENTTDETLTILGAIFIILFCTVGLVTIPFYFEQLFAFRINCCRFSLLLFVYLVFLVWFIVETAIEVSFATWNSRTHDISTALAVILTLFMGVHSFFGFYLLFCYIGKKFEYGRVKSNDDEEPEEL